MTTGRSLEGGGSPTPWTSGFTVTVACQTGTLKLQSSTGTVLISARE